VGSSVVVSVCRSVCLNLIVCVCHLLSHSNADIVQNTIMSFFKLSECCCWRLLDDEFGEHRFLGYMLIVFSIWIVEWSWCVVKNRTAKCIIICIMSTFCSTWRNTNPNGWWLNTQCTSCHATGNYSKSLFFWYRYCCCCIGVLLLYCWIFLHRDGNWDFFTYREKKMMLV